MLQQQLARYAFVLCWLAWQGAAAADAASGPPVAASSIALTGRGGGDDHIQRRASRKRWVLSWVAVAAASAIDIHSSLGHAEAHPLLRNQGGRFAPGKASLIKSAVMGGFCASQILWVRHRPDKDLYRPFTLANTVAAGSLAGIAARNYSLPPPRRPYAARSQAVMPQN